jgi:hypothetical protein
MPAAAPPMTTRQARRLGKAQAAQFTYTASQMRCADRREELQDRKRRIEEKERKKKANKRKRELQQEKERTRTKQLLEEGKMDKQEIWGKVTASQPRLNEFFNSKHTRATSVSTKNTENDSEYSQEDTLVDPNAAVVPCFDRFDDQALVYISDQDLQLASLQPHSPNTLASSVKPHHSQSKKVSSDTNPSPSRKMLKRRRTSSASSLVQQTLAEGRPVDFEVAEDGTARLEFPQAHDSTKTDPSRSVLSEMSVANINTRAQEKPDTTSAPLKDCGIMSPTVDLRTVSQSTDLFDFGNDELNWDKENTDPLSTPGKKDKCQQKVTAITALASQARSSKGPAVSGFGKFDDCEDIFDFDFDTADVEDDDAEILVKATAHTSKSHVIDLQGTPQKLSPMKDAIVRPPPINFTPKKSISCHQDEPNQQEASKFSVSFSSVLDEDLLAIADRVEEQLSQKRPSKQKDLAQEPESNRNKPKRKLPWLVDRLPPPSTQDYLLQLADEEVELEDE